MPPPCICLFQPRLLFPYDDYRGPLGSVSIVCLGVCVEVLCFFLCFLWGVVCIHRSYSQHHWALLPLPLLVFDLCILFSGAARFVRSYAWLLPSEKRLRVIVLLGVASRLLLCVLFSLHILGKVPLVTLLGVSAASYSSSTALNIDRNDAYTWARLQCWDLVVLLQLGTLCLQSLPFPAAQTLGSFLSNSYACTWPLWVLAGGHLCCCLLLGLLLLRDALLQQNTITRVLVHLSEMHAVAFLLCIIALSQWLSVHLNSRFVVFVSAGVASFFLLMLFAAFVSICFIANHSRALTDDVEQRAPNDRGISSLPASSAAAAAAAVGPPLMCDMKLTLERVSEHFYRIGGPAEGPSAHDHLQAQGPLYDEPLKANNPTAVQDSTGEGNSLHWASPGGTTTHQEEKKEGDPQDTPTQGAAGTHETTAVDVQPEAGANAAPTDVTASEERLLRESELCIICCNTVGCLYT